MVEAYVRIPPSITTFLTSTADVMNTKHHNYPWSTHILIKQYIHSHIVQAKSILPCPLLVIVSIGRLWDTAVTISLPSILSQTIWSPLLSLDKVGNLSVKCNSSLTILWHRATNCPTCLFSNARSSAECETNSLLHQGPKANLQAYRLQTRLLFIVPYIAGILFWYR